MAKTLQFNLNVLPEYKFYFLMCGIFGPKYSPVKHWEEHESVFEKLISTDPNKGSLNLFQSVLLLFKSHPSMSPQLETFLHKLYEREVISEQLLLDWFYKRLPLDKHSILYPGSAHDQAMRALVTGLINVIENGEYDDEEEEEEQEVIKSQQ